MDFMPSSRVVRVSDARWSRFLIRDAHGQYFAQNHWSNSPSDAVLFHREVDAIEARNRLGFTGDAADTFMATIVLTVHQDKWTVEELVAYMKRHRQSSLRGAVGKRGILLEILPDGIRKVEQLVEKEDESD